ncbi:uncharacterized protein LOC144220220 [Crocuta crocuta]
MSAVSEPQAAHSPLEKPPSTAILCNTCGNVCKGEVLRVQNKYFHIKCFVCKDAPAKVDPPEKAAVREEGCQVSPRLPDPQGTTPGAPLGHHRPRHQELMQQAQDPALFPGGHSVQQGLRPPHPLTPLGGSSAASIVHTSRLSPSPSKSGLQRG